jgi:hypothetical protein
MFLVMEHDRTAQVIGTLGLHPRRRDRIAIIRDSVATNSFGADQGWADVVALLAEHGCDVDASGVVTCARS